MATSNSDGSQTATIDTEHTLATITAAGTYVLYVDLNALVNGDTVILKAKTKVRSVGTTRLLHEVVYANVQSEKIAMSLAIPSINEIVFTLEQTDGTGRAFPWEIVEL